MSLDMLLHALRMEGEQMQPTADMVASPWYSEVLEEAGDITRPDSLLGWFAREQNPIVPPDRLPDLLRELQALDLSAERFPKARPMHVEQLQREHRAVMSFIESALERHEHVWLSAAPRL